MGGKLIVKFASGGYLLFTVFFFFFYWDMFLLSCVLCICWKTWKQQLAMLGCHFPLFFLPFPFPFPSLPPFPGGAEAVYDTRSCVCVCVGGEGAVGGGRCSTV